LTSFLKTPSMKILALPPALAFEAPIQLTEVPMNLKVAVAVG
jgi:hypothetical protein